MSANPGRVAAVLALVQIEAGVPSDVALATLAPEGRDRALCWHLVLGVLRHQAQVDAALRPQLRQPLTAMDPPVRAVLRVGAFEKLHTRVPARAAVHQAVEVARRTGAKRASGLVNAVLRRACEPSHLSRADQLNHPDWLIERWTARYGQAATDAWCAANNQPAHTYVVAPRGVEFEVRPTTLLGLEGVFELLADGPIDALQGYDQGRFWVQDPASVAVADMIGAGKGLRVLDVCAAPGGKSFRLASQGASVTATDLSDERLARLYQGASRLGMLINTATHDWSKGPREGSYDAVLVDAPCSGLGTIRRHPEIRWRRQEPDLVGAAVLQAKILTNASQAVAVGGVLVYAVCSPAPEEGSQVVSAFLAAHPDFELEHSLDTAPPSGDHDAHQGFKMRRR